MKKVYLSIYFLLLTSCSGVKFSNWHLPYMMEIQQGKYITNAQIEQIKIGSNKEQVMLILGKPLSQDMFQKNIWVYNYQDSKNYKLIKEYIIKITFNNDLVIKIDKSDNLFKK